VLIGQLDGFPHGGDDGGTIVLGKSGSADDR